MNIDDYESLPTTSISINMTAGALAGVLEHCIMYPLDSVKTRMQHISPTIPSYNIAETFRNMINKEGIMRPIRGVTAVVAGAGPAHALYFASYELTKEFFTKFTAHNHINYMASGVIATLIHDAVSNPTEVIKQRMQMYNSPYKSVVQCMRDVYRKEGFKAFYRSYATQLVMNIPYQMIHFPTYEFFQNMLNNERKYNAPVHMIAGAAAGATAAAITTPLDVMKTLLNTQETGLTKGMIEAARQIYNMAGASGFFKGLTARVLYSMPATAICWSTYEFFKFYLCGIHPEKYKSSITGKSTLAPRPQPPTTTSATFIDSQLITEATILKVQNVDKETDGGYVLTATPQETVQENPTTTTTNNTTASPNITTPTTPSGPIKTVCELSSTITSPTLNLNTRHKDVEIPFDRKYSST